MYMDRKLVYITHILFVAPLLIYCGYIGKNECNDKHQGIFLMLLMVGITVLLYHGYLLYKYMLL